MRLALVLAALLSGCAYESQYVAPMDGRARAVWQNDNVALHLGGAPVSDACLEQLRGWSADHKLRLVAGYVPQDRPLAPRAYHGDPAVFVGFWVPVYYGPPLVPPAPGIVPVLPHPVLFAPSPLPVVALPKGAAVSGSGFGSVGGSNDLGKALVVLAVVALAVLPIVDVALAAATPENDRSSDAIDQANVFNDLARIPDTACSYGWAP